MPVPADLVQILEQYPLLPAVQTVEHLGGAGGFSGAEFWRILTSRGRFCLRRWPPEHPTRERLQSIHAVLQAASRDLPQILPVPLTCVRGASYTEHAGSLWELTPWLPGAADYHQQPRPARLAAAMTALARFHQAAAAAVPAKPLAPSPGIRSRQQRLKELLAGLDTLAAAIADRGWPEFRQAAGHTLALFQFAASTVGRQLIGASTLEVALQPCIRDIWHDHVLFTDDEVTGIVDFGAMNTESVAADIARLLGSLVEDDDQAWKLGRDAYERIRPLPPAERELVSVFDASNVLLSGMNWLDWMFVQGRRFDAPARVLNRILANQRRLERLASTK